MKCKIDCEHKKELEDLKKKVEVFTLQGGNVMDKAFCMALGSAQLDIYKYRKSKVAIDYLKLAVESLSKINDTAVLDIAIGNDLPICIGTYDGKTNTITGIIIAPRVDG